MPQESTSFGPVRRHGVQIGGLLATLLVAASVANEQVPRREAFFGDLHIHTAYSLDAFIWQARATPDDAYRFAKGQAIRHMDRLLRLRGPRLDFLAVTDHAEFLGVGASLADPSSLHFDHPDKERLLSLRLDDAFGVLMQLREEGDPLAGPELLVDAWRRSVEAARHHNSPGEFTAFVGYEFTGAPHRNVIFKDGNPPTLPFSALNSERPEDLWHWMDELREGGIEVLAIPHNGNLWIERAWHAYGKGRLTPAQAEQRGRLEPLLEIYQQKGASAAHPLLSPNDEWADFSLRRTYFGRPVLVGTVWRTLLARGMAFEEQFGVNPYRQGAAAGSDNHYAAGSYNQREVTFGGPKSYGAVYPEELGGWENFRTPLRASNTSGGLTGIWAEENTRAALFDAMLRRETFATSGPRITVRLFGGFGLPALLAEADGDAVAAGYRHGVPMGQQLKGDRRDEKAPSFLAWALRDPRSQRLQRLQIVKGELVSAGSGWLYAAAHMVPDGFERLSLVREYRKTGGAEMRERVFDVACSDGGQPDPDTHRCPDNGAAVDLTDCSVSADAGAEALRAVWTDPEFDPNRRSYYYLRVLENPSCRWSTWEAIRHGVSPNPDLPATIQDRAWSSPIWYSP